MIPPFCSSTVDAGGRELTAHGTSLFPIACYHDDLVLDPVPWHWHDELELAVVTEGSCSLLAGNQRCELKQGEGFFINAGILHAAPRPEKGEGKLHSLVFHPRLVGGSLDSVFWQRYLHPLMKDHRLECLVLSPAVPWQQELLSQLEAAWDCCVREAPGYEFQVRSCLSRIIWLLDSHRGAESTPGPSEKELRDSQRIKQMLQYIHDHYGEEISSFAIARSAGLSERECLRCFHATIGLTPGQYLKRYRLQQAARLLSSTPLPVSQIAQQCGFQEMSYFSKAFRQLYSCPPRDFRCMAQKEPRR